MILTVFPGTAIAVSGGVDSMALAHLCSRLRRADPLFRISDNPVGGFVALTVNHRLRAGSGEEAKAVRDAVRDMGLNHTVIPLRWRDAARRDVDPSTLPNVETLARRLRYRAMGYQVRWRGLVSLLMAHHEDDQYETVLMRLMAGHGPRGLRGMRAAHDIPECYDMHGVYQSGFVDDQRLKNPFYNLRPTRRERKYVKLELIEDMDPEVFARELGTGLQGDVDLFDPQDGLSLKKSARTAPPLSPLDIEDSGIMIYRPLLEFSKDRLIATCLENNVPWFEDHTNSDPTLTTRNALRHLWKNHQLPAALQKSAVLQLAARCRRSIAAEEAEAERLAGQCLVQHFGPNAGTLLLQLPVPQSRARRQGSVYTKAWRERRLRHMRTVAALLVRKLLRIVSPEHHLTPVANLGAFVTILFPSLGDVRQGTAGPPKAFSVCGVHFVPIQSGQGSLSWFLSRAPYPSTSPLPAAYFSGLAAKVTLHSRPEHWKWPEWSPWRLFDGRFWIRVRNRLPSGIVAMPFVLEHAKPFREALLEDHAKDTLAALLKKHAPGKVRYTLPALYAVREIDWALEGLPDPRRGDAARAADDEEADNDAEAALESEPEVDDDLPENNQSADRRHVASQGKWKGGGLGALRLLALPTLGVHLPGIEHWLQWEVRYRKVDGGLLERDDAARGPWNRRAGRRRWVVLGRWGRWRRRTPGEKKRLLGEA